MDVTVELPDFDEALPLLMEMYGWDDAPGEAVRREARTEVRVRRTAAVPTGRSFHAYDYGCAADGYAS